MGDCAAPSVCIVDATGRGACTVVEDETCAAGCSDPLVCDDGHCVQRCDVADDCAAGLACIDGSCARPSGSPCELLTGEGCEAGRRCELLADDTLGCVAVTVAREDMRALHEACGEGQACEAGLRCVAGRCIRYCLREGTGGEALTSCGLGSHCFEYDEVGEPAPSPEIGYCSEPCDPIADDDCQPGHRCAIAYAEPLYQSTCRIDSQSCDGGVGDALCELGAPNPTGCGRGLVSSQHLRGVWADGFVMQRCARPCAEDAHCGAGFECWTETSFDIEDRDGTARRIGFCLPTCEGGACGDTETALGLACEPSGRFCTWGCASDADCHATMRCLDDRCTPR